MYKAHVNPENPLGTIQSIEHVLRGLDKALEDEQARAERAEKMLGDFREQLGKPFAHEARLKDFGGRQAELNAALDLDKGDLQAAEADREGEGNPDGGSDGAAPRRRERGFAAPAARPRTVRGPAPRPGG